MDKALLLQQVPLCVDLDGALVKSDTLFESVVLLARRTPWMLLLLPFWLLRGRSYFKQRVSELVQIDPALLPYNAEFLEYVRACYIEGRPVILVTAADERIANGVSRHLGIFTEVLSSSGGVNLKGKHKRALLEKRFGAGNFDYCGNSSSDLTIWESSRKAVLVHAPWWAPRALRSRKITIERNFRPSVHPLKALLKSMRVYQWTKNALLFVPLILAHGPFTIDRILAVISGFVAFSLAASSIYLANDLLDIHSDRQHPTKRKRPLAAGDLPASIAVFTIPLLIALALSIALFLPRGFLVTLGVYMALASAYSFYLKKKLVLDTLVLAMLYGLRLFAGGAAASVKLTPWLLGFSIFFFFSLALIKRTSELQGHSKKPLELVNSSRGYMAGDLAYLPIMGISSATMSTLILALYIQAPDVTALYRTPEWLWGICVLELYWLMRLWLLSLRGKVLEDPILFATKDKVSYLIFASLAVLMRLAV